MQGTEDGHGTLAMTPWTWMWQVSPEVCVGRPELDAFQVEFMLVQLVGTVVVMFVVVLLV